MATADVRIATADDVDDITRIHRETWRIAYSDLLGSDVFDELNTAATRSSWLHAIDHPDSSVHVATEGSYLVGFCVSGSAGDADVARASGELPADHKQTGLISTILVEPRWARRGHGGRLLEAAAKKLRLNGHQRGICWLPQTNAASLNFFRRAGWQLDGTVRTLDTGTKLIREVRVTGSLDLSLTERGDAQK